MCVVARPHPARFTQMCSHVSVQRPDGGDGYMCRLRGCVGPTDIYQDLASLTAHQYSSRHPQVPMLAIPAVGESRTTEMRNDNCDVTLRAQANAGNPVFGRFWIYSAGPLSLISALTGEFSMGGRRAGGHQAQQLAHQQRMGHRACEFTSCSCRTYPQRQWLP